MHAGISSRSSEDCMACQEELHGCCRLQLFTVHHGRLLLLWAPSGHPLSVMKCSALCVRTCVLRMRWQRDQAKNAALWQLAHCCFKTAAMAARGHPSLLSEQAQFPLCAPESCACAGGDAEPRMRRCGSPPAAAPRPQRAAAASGSRQARLAQQASSRRCRGGMRAPAPLAACVATF